MPKTPKNLPSDVATEDLRWLLGGLSRARLTQLEQAGIIERTTRGRYALASIPNFIQWQRQQGVGPREWQEARTALLKERALAAKQARLEREGKMLGCDIVVALGAANNRIVRDRFLGLGSKVGPAAHSARTVADVVAIVDREARKILEHLSEQGQAELLERMKNEMSRRVNGGSAK